MLLSRIRSFQSKLIILVVLAGVLSALLVGGTLLVREYVGSRTRAIGEARTLARSHTFHIIPTLELERPDEARNLLSNLIAVPDFGAAMVYDARGEPYAEFARQTDAPALPQEPPDRDYAALGWLWIVEPIIREEERIGTLVLAYDLGAIAHRRNLNAMLSAVMAVLATGLALAIALRLQRAITRAFAELFTTARRVSETQDYSVRAQKFEEDELGQFTDVFNEMLRQVDRNNEAIRLANERFRMAVEASPNGMVMVNERGDIVLVNAQTEHLFGYGREELIGRSVDVLVPGRFREHAHFRDMFFHNPESRPMGAGRELFGLRKDSTEFPVEIGLNPIQTDEGLRVLSSIVDITQRKAAEQAVRDSEQRLRTLMNAIPAIIWTADANGAGTSFNNQWFDYTGLTAAESLSGLRRRFPVGPPREHERDYEALPHTRGWMKAVHDADREHCAARWEASIKEGADFECELRLRRHDGVYRWFLVRALPLRDEHGVITGWFGTTTDIEDRKLAEEERDHLLASERVARSEAERASRAKDEFVATLSHELRTPLTAILGWAQMLRSGALPKDQYEQGYEIILRNARMQTQLIEDLLDMSRIMSGKIRLDVQQVDLPAVIDAAVETVQPGADAKEIRIQKIIDPRSAPVRGDPDRLQQVIWNLLSNAIKFTQKGGRVQIALQRINSHVEIAVSDTGEGIDPEFLPHIFERFRQADPSTTRRHGGLGLGLAIVKQLIELHGGAISAASPGAGKGATFTIRLPIAVVHATADDDDAMRHPIAPAVSRRTMEVGFGFGRDGNGRERAEASATSLAGVRVLVVEDEPDARELISRVLGARGALVEAAASGGEGLERAGEFKPDVIVSDIGMPVMDGYEFIRRLRSLPREEGGRAPAVALTAFARTEDRTRSLLAGYQMHVAKPVDPAELVASVASLAAMGERHE